MVNVDVSPSVVLGVGLIGAGVSLWQIRRVKPWISKDYDVVVSCISLLVGGILIFQGWRLDPLLLFGQLMTTGAAVSFAIEALRLRSEMYESEEKAALQDVFKRKGPGGGGAGGAFQLPPPEASPAAPWAADASGEQAWAAQQQWQAPAEGAAGYYDYQQQAGPAVASGSGYAYDQQQQGGWDAGAAAAGGLYQPAEYDAPAGDQAAAGAAYYGAPGYPNSRGVGAGAPSELAFPASYSDPGAPADGGGAAGGWGGGYGAQQPGGGSGGSGSSKAYDNMDDW